MIPNIEIGAGQVPRGSEPGDPQSPPDEDPETWEESEAEILSENDWEDNDFETDAFNEGMMIRIPSSRKWDRKLRMVTSSKPGYNIYTSGEPLVPNTQPEIWTEVTRDNQVLELNMSADNDILAPWIVRGPIAELGIPPENVTDQPSSGTNESNMLQHQSEVTIPIQPKLAADPLDLNPSHGSESVAGQHQNPHAVSTNPELPKDDSSDEILSRQQDPSNPSQKLDPWEDQVLLSFLQQGCYPREATTEERRKLRRRARPYSWNGHMMQVQHRGRKMKIPRPRERPGILRSCHHQALHAGITKTQQAIMKAKYYWPKLHTDVKRLIASCDVCQKVNPTFFITPKLVQNPAPRAFGRWGIDLLCSFSHHQWAKYCIVAIDYFTKWVELGALASRTSAVVAAWIEDNVICRFPYPDEIITDQGAEFGGHTHLMLKAYSIRHRKARPRHPQSNGLVERCNRTIKQRMHAALTENPQCTWDQLIQRVAMSIRTTSQSSTGLSPFELTFGRVPRLILDADLHQSGTDPNETLLITRDRLEQYENQARNRIKQAQIRQQRGHERKGGRKRVKVGDLVLVRKRPDCRQDLTVDGPYKVTKIDQKHSKIRVPDCPRGEWVTLDDAAPYRA